MHVATDRKPAAASSNDQGQDIATMLRARRKAMTAPELAEILSCSVEYIYSAAKAKRIPSLRVGSLVRFDPKLIADWLDRKKVA